ncbi:MAG: hypothetical protein WCC01_01100 [Acidimicrobiia bacterium]
MSLPASTPEALIVRAILRFREILAEQEARRVVPILTDRSAANEFLMADDWAFLAGVIGDYQMPAERAWAVPYNLSRRLGGWGVHIVADNPERVLAAFLGPPALHRFPTQSARWLVAGAQRVIDDYGGEAGAVWNDRPAARQLQERLSEFVGISQKKAAMAVEILSGQRGIEIRDLFGSDIAYDVHVRRVMLRTGLAERDQVDHMVDVARRLNPDRPGALDLPMWEIGRTWCHARNPGCEACEIKAVCPRLVDAAASVRGA